MTRRHEPDISGRLKVKTPTSTGLEPDPSKTAGHGNPKDRM